MRSTTALLTLTYLFSSSVSAQSFPKLSDATASSSSNTAAAASTTTTAGTSTSQQPASGTSGVTASASDLPKLTTATNTAYDGITGAPTLSGGFSYPPPTVPPTANAPFMQRSNLPNGTVFICVGAALGFALLVFLAWRGLVACLLNRRMRMGNRFYGTSKLGDESKSMLPQLYGHGGSGAVPLEPLTANGKMKKTASVIPHSSSLFFSPTAGAGMHTNSAAPSRGSTYLPAGFYKSGGSIPGLNDSTTALTGRPISMADFPVETPSTEYRRSIAREGSPTHRLSRYDSPGASPLLTPQGPYGRRDDAASSSTSLHGGIGSRPPSQLLDDILDLQPTIPRYQ